MSTTYPKIETLFVRDDNFKVTSQVRRPVFNDIRHWVATEKIDGTNIRIVFTLADDGSGTDRISYHVYGRTDKAIIPSNLMHHCSGLAKSISGDVTEIMFGRGLETYTLYGEGYGAGIQKGGAYSPHQLFILFDIKANGMWLTDDDVTEAAEMLLIPRVPILGRYSIGELVGIVRKGFASQLGTNPPAEGIVARTREPLFDRRGNRMILKIKTQDFR